jgi:hypothetical protein
MFPPWKSDSYSIFLFYLGVSLHWGILREEGMDESGDVPTEKRLDVEKAERGTIV